MIEIKNFKAGNIYRAKRYIPGLIYETIGKYKASPRLFDSGETSPAISLFDIDMKESKLGVGFLLAYIEANNVFKDHPVVDELLQEITTALTTGDYVLAQKFFGSGAVLLNGTMKKIWISAVFLPFFEEMM